MKSCATCGVEYNDDVPYCILCHDSFWLRQCPPLFLKTEPAKLNQERLKQVLAWQYSPKGLVLFGPSGTGKTRMSILLMKREYDTGKSVELFLGPRFAHECATRFMESDGSDWFDRLAKVDLLLLDDVDKMKLTERVEWEFYALLDCRINFMLPTILTCNLNGKLLENKFSVERAEPLLRRMREFFTPVKF